MLEFTNENHTYRARKLDTFDQMHVLKRVGPLILRDHAAGVRRSAGRGQCGVEWA